VPAEQTGKAEGRKAEYDDAWRRRRQELEALRHAATKAKRDGGGVGRVGAVGEVRRLLLAGVLMSSFGEGVSEGRPSAEPKDRRTVPKVGR